MIISERVEFYIGLQIKNNFVIIEWVCNNYMTDFKNINLSEGFSSRGSKLARIAKFGTRVRFEGKNNPPDI